jgi:predicted RNA-binding Zn-ribbon protein involved in translation (DUF1610 family)
MNICNSCGEHFDQPEHNDVYVGLTRIYDGDEPDRTEHCPNCGSEDICDEQDVETLVA